MARLGRQAFILQVSFLLLCAATVANARKNVLFIMADDMRVEAEPFRDQWGFSVAPDELHTPKLEELAATGTTFHRTYCQVSLCGPSRTSMMTGRRPDTSQVYSNNPYWRDNYPFKSLPQYFKENGYTTAGIGKIYHGDYDGGVNGGYDHPSWSWEKGYKFHTPSTLTYWNAKNKDSHLAVDENDKSTYRRDLMDRETAKKAVEWIQQLKNDDFFLAVGFKLPHLAWVAPQEFFAKHAGNGSVPDNMYVPNDLPSPAFSDSSDLRKHNDIPSSWTGTQNSVLDDTTTKKLREAYYASISFVDSLVGDLIDALKNNGLYDDTVIVFTSDHGFHLGEHNIWGKKTNFEVSNQVPLIISAPGYRNGARSSSELVELIDLFPTVVDLAGLTAVPLCDEANSATTEVCREGTSVVPLLSDNSGTTWNKGAVFHQYARNNKMGLSIRTEEYRYTIWLRCDGKTKAWNWNNRVFGYELYDLRTDTYENVNLAYTNTNLRKTLHTQLVEGWRKHV